MPWRALVGGVLGFALLILGVLICVEAVTSADRALLWLLPPALFPGALTLWLAYLVLRLCK